jgi:hypothetical protein
VSMPTDAHPYTVRPHTPVRNLHEFSCASTPSNLMLHSIATHPKSDQGASIHVGAIRLLSRLECGRRETKKLCVEGISSRG